LALHAEQSATCQLDNEWIVAASLQLANRSRFQARAGHRPTAREPAVFDCFQ
jgi:hypothetical protein